MGNKAIELKIDRYVNEELSELTDIINKGENILLTAPTGSGKSTAIIEYCRKHPHKSIAFLCPLRSLVDNLGKQNTDVSCGYRFEFIKNNIRTRFVITTYDSIKWLKNIDLLFIDEAHLIAGHSSFRAIISKILEYKGQKVLITGTPELIDLIPGYGRVNFLKYTQPRFVNVVQTSRDPIDDILNIIMDKNRDENALTLIRHNRKDTLIEIYEKFNHMYEGKIAMYFSSDSLPMVQDEALMDDLKRGVIPTSIEILLCTSIFDAGLSLEVSRPVNCYAIAVKGREFMPNAIDMVQLMARVRTGQGTMKMTIMGKYGDMPYGYDGFHLPNHPKQICNLLAMAYNWFNELDMESYNYVLEKYGIRVDEIKNFDYNVTIRDFGSKSRHIALAKNYHNFRESFVKISELCRSHDISDWMKFIMGEEIIKCGKPPIKVLDMEDDFIKAIKYNIHFSLFVKNRYESVKIKNLINAAEEYSRDEDFRIVLDEVIAGADLNPNDKHIIPLKGFKLLIRTQKEMIREVARLLYDGRLWGEKRKTITLTRLENNEYVDNYISTLKYGIDETWDMIVNAV